MNIINLFLALALVAALWVGIVRVLAALLGRPDFAQEAPARLAVKVARWRRLPVNRMLAGRPISPGPENGASSVGIVGTKDLLA